MFGLTDKYSFSLRLLIHKSENYVGEKDNEILFSNYVKV